MVLVIKRNELIKLRLQRGYLSKQFANIIGLDHKTVQKIEKKEIEVINKKDAIKICNALDAEINDLFHVVISDDKDLREIKVKEVINSANKKYINADELSELLKISKSTIKNLQKKGMPCLKINRLIRFCYSDVYLWLKSQQEQGIAK
jgi:DNA-binding Xre family transcriptional regulator